MTQKRLEPKYQYVELLVGIQKREREILFCSDNERNKRRNAYNKNLRDVADPMFSRWSRLYSGFIRRSQLTTSEVNMLSSSGNDLLPAYAYINSLPPPLYAEQEIEVRRLTTVFVQYYKWLSKLKLNEDQLSIFQTIDELLQVRAHTIMSAHLWREDKVELEEIFQVIDLEISRTHGHLVPGERVEVCDGWIIDRSAEQCQQQHQSVIA